MFFSRSANANPKLKEQLAKKLSTEHKNADKMDTGYAEQVSKLQELQVKCFETEVPAVLAEFEKLERGRIEAVKTALLQYVELEKKIPQLYEEANRKMHDAVAAIDEESDIAKFISAARSGAAPPPRAQYHPYDESAGRCMAPSSSISVGFAPGGRVPAAAVSGSPGGVTVMEATSTPQRAVSPRSMTTTSSPAITTTSRSNSSLNVSSKSISVVSKSARAPAPVTQPTGIGKCTALYDYDGQGDQELTFRQGDIIVILEKDESGWWQGELNGKIGIFPAAEWVEEIDEAASSSSYSSLPKTSPLAKSSSSSSSGFTNRQCVALYDYNANDEDELTIYEGEILNIDYEDSGWFIGSNQKGIQGRYPSNFCELLEK